MKNLAEIKEWIEFNVAEQEMFGVGEHEEEVKENLRVLKIPIRKNTIRAYSEGILQALNAVLSEIEV